MKNLFFLLILGSLCFTAYGQNSQPSQIQLDLIRKSDKQYKVGWILLGSGTALSLAAIAIPNPYDEYGNRSGNKTAVAILGWTGFLSISTSIPFFLSAGQNARTAAKLSLESQTMNQPVPIPGTSNRIPSLSLKIPL